MANVEQEVVEVTEEEEEAIEEEELEEEDNLLNLLFNQKIHRMEVSIIIDRPRMVQ